MLKRVAYGLMLVIPMALTGCQGSGEEGSDETIDQSTTGTPAPDSTVMPGDTMPMGGVTGPTTGTSSPGTGTTTTSM